MWKADRRCIALLLWGAFLAPLAARGEIEVNGRVRAPEGAPMAQARVALIEVESRFERGGLVSAGEIRKPPVATTRTDEAGRFRIAAPTAGMWTVLVEAPGRMAWECPLGLLEPSDLPTVMPREARDVALRIVDARGRPVSGALATVSEASRWNQQLPASGDWWPAAQLARAGDDGQVVLARGVTKRIEILVWAPGYLEKEVEPGRGQPEVSLRRGTPRTLEVRRADGRPAPGVLVLVGRGRWPAGRTDEHGRVTVAAPVREALALELVTSESRTSRVTLLAADAPEPDDPEPDVPEPTIFSLPAERQLGGEVVDARTREPIAGALVWTVADRAVFTRTDQGGAYVLTDPGAAVTLVAKAVGYLRRPSETADFHGAEGLTMALEPAAMLLGEVVDELDRPLAGVEIEANGDVERNHLLEPPLPVAARTDESGRFRLPHLLAERSHELILRAPGFASMRFTVSGIAPGGVSEGLRLVLQRGRLAVGKVLDASGRAVTNAEVVLYPSRGSSRDRPLKDDVHGTLSQPDGGFGLPHVLAGQYDLGISALGFSPTLVRGLEIADATGPLDLGTVFLDPEAILEGRITDPHGQPLEGVVISFIPLVYEVGSGDDHLSIQRVTRTGPRGEFVLGGFYPGQKVDLKLSRDGYEPREIFGVEAPAADALAFVLEPASVVSGRVVSSGGEPVARVQVALDPGGAGLTSGGGILGPGGGTRSVTTGDDGEFAIPSVLPGRYSLSASAEGYLRSEPADFEVLAGEHRGGLNLVLESGATVAGRVLDAAGRPVTDARVTVVKPRPRSGEAGLRIQTQSDGSYQLEGLVTGAVSVEATHPKHSPKVGDLEVRPGFNRFDLTLEAGFEVSGRVVDESRAPVEGATIRLTGSVRKTVKSDPDGSFVFAGVPEDAYQIRATKKGHAEARPEVPIQVPGPAARGLEMLLGNGGSVAGSLVGLDEGDLAEVAVTAANGRGSRVEGSVDYEGHYRIDHLSPGDWTVTATLRGGQRWASERTTLEAGVPQVILDLDFESGMALSGEVRHAGQPIAGALVVVTGQDLELPQTGRTGPAGRFRLQGFEAGIHRLVIADFTAGLYHEQQVELDTDRDLLIEIDTTELSGRVVDGDGGMPVAGAVIELEPLSDAGSGLALKPGAVTDDLGLFAFPHLSRGDWLLKARKEGYSSVQTEVREATVDDLVIALRTQTSETERR